MRTNQKQKQKPKPSLEILECRYAPSGGLTLADGQVFGIQGPVTYSSLTIPATAELDIAPGVPVTVGYGGVSSIAGTVKFGDPLSTLDFRGGMLAIQGAHIGANPSPDTPGNLYLDNGIQTTINDAVFGCNVYTGYDPLTGFSKPSTSTTFTGKGSTFVGGGNPGYYSSAQTFLSVAGTNLQGNGVFDQLSGAVNVTTAGAGLGMLYMQGHNTGATLYLGINTTLNVQPIGIPLPHSPAFSYQDVYLDSPGSLQIGTGASLTTSSFTYQGVTYFGGMEIYTLEHPDG